MTNQWRAATRFRFSIQPFARIQYLKIAHKICCFNGGKHTQQYDHTVIRDYDPPLMSQFTPFKKHAIIPQKPSFPPLFRSSKRPNKELPNKGWRVGGDEGASLTGGWGDTLAKQPISIAPERWVMHGDAHPLTTDAIYTAPYTQPISVWLLPNYALRFNAANRPIRANNEQSA